MNILFIHPAMFHPLRGGTERVSDLLCREFVKRGHHVLYLNNICDEGRLDYPYPAQVYFFPKAVSDLEENGDFYRKFLMEHQVDIVINQDPMSYYALCAFSKGLQSVRTISVMHFNPLGMYDHLYKVLMWVKGKDGIIGKIRKKLRFLKLPFIKYKYLQMQRANYKCIFDGSDAVCLLSSKFVPELKRAYSGDLSRLIIIPNPNTYPVRENDAYPKKKQILYVGRIRWRQKRVDRLIEIWNYLYKDFPDWELTIIGDGLIREELERRARQMERVRFVGWEDPEPYYRTASILCLTSDYEGWGMVLTEAMTFGAVPVVFNSFAAVTDIIEDGKTGVLVPPFSCKRFARRLGMLMNDEERRAAMSEACVRSVKRFDIQTVADQWEAVFEKLKEHKK